MPEGAIRIILTVEDEPIAEQAMEQTVETTTKKLEPTQKIENQDEAGKQNEQSPIEEEPETP
jgi:hypothetical protein